MAESFELPDETERLQINLEDDVRAFLLSQLSGNQLDAKKRAQLVDLGVDVRRLSKPSYIAVNSGCDVSDDNPTERCYVGAEGVMVHEDEAMVHLAFKCGDADHDMHYTKFMPLSIIEMAKAMEAVWPGSVMVPMLDQAVKLGRAKSGPLPPGFFMSDQVDEEGAQRLLKAINRMDEEGPDFDFDENDEFDEEEDSEDLESLGSEDLEIFDSQEDDDLYL